MTDTGMREFYYSIGKEHEGKTVQDYLRHEKGFSRNMIIKLKHDKQGVLLNGAHIRMVDSVSRGDELYIRFRDTESPIPPNGELDVEIAYEDEDVLVVNKPAGMPIHPSRNHKMDTLGNFYAYYYRKYCYKFRPIYRLDADTTGLCVLAKNHLTAKKLNRRIYKEYLVMVHGQLELETGRIDLPLGRVDGTRIKRCVDVNGQEAATNYTVCNRCDEYTVLRVWLETGRTHQIRAHFAHIGHPLLGDTMYGTPSQRIGRQALHVEMVRFCHPISGEEMCIYAQLPKDMQDLQI